MNSKLGNCTCVARCKITHSVYFPAERIAEVALCTWRKSRLSFWLWLVTSSLTFYASFPLRAAVAATGFIVATYGLISALIGLGFELLDHKTQLKYINYLHSVSPMTDMNSGFLLRWRFLGM